LLSVAVDEAVFPRLRIELDEAVSDALIMPCVDFEERMVEHWIWSMVRSFSAGAC